MGMHFRSRDGNILRTIYAYDGMLHIRHIHEIFFPGKTVRPVQRRLQKMVESEYLRRPTEEQWNSRPSSRGLYWLDWKGILYVAERAGIDVEPPKKSSKEKLRLFNRRLQKHNVHWRREPRWSQIAHDMRVADFRIALERSVGQLPYLYLEIWLHEGYFKSGGEADTVYYNVEGGDGKVRQGKKKVCPDSYFKIVNTERLARGQKARARFSLEIDMANHPGGRFGLDKVAAGGSWILSPEYKARFGFNGGRWLVVTTSRKRMNNLMRHAQQMGGKLTKLFFFSTFDQYEYKEGASDGDQVRPPNVMTDPIWWQCERAEPVALVPEMYRREVKVDGML